MGDNSGIEWTGATWPIVTGCEHVSEGCDLCYSARETAGRLKHHPAYEGLAFIPESGGPAQFTGEVRCNHDRLDWPLRWRRPRLIFTSSMGDVWHKDVPLEFLVEIFAVMAAASQHTFQVLTKRPQRQAHVLTTIAFWDRVAATTARRYGVTIDPNELELPNVWLGTSIETPRWAGRASHVRRTPAALRFLSVEPLLADVAPALDLTGIGWVIVGGESGRGARPMHPAWAIGVRDLCAAAGVPVFFKQWGEWYPRFDATPDQVTLPDGSTLKPFAVVDPGPGCDAPRVVMERVGKRAAGAELDGRAWREMPAGAVLD